MNVRLEVFKLQNPLATQVAVGRVNAVKFVPSHSLAECNGNKRPSIENISPETLIHTRIFPIFFVFHENFHTAMLNNKQTFVFSKLQTFELIS